MGGPATVAALLGSEHDQLGEVAVRSLSPRVAIALSAGMYRKGYAHLDVNEDAVLAAADDSFVLLAVADGHSGFDAARTVIGALEQEAAVLLRLAPDAPRALRAAFTVASRAIAGSSGSWQGDRRYSRTTLSVCVGGPAAAAAGTLGDSACVHVRGRRVRPIGAPGPFLDGTVTWDPGRGESVRLRKRDRFCVVSDGVSTFLDPPWERRAGMIVRAATTAADAANDLIRAAFDGGAGDNVAGAVWIP